MNGASIRASVRAAGILAASLWMGGFTVLGAVVAPFVFHHVAAPTSADVMTLVFQRFDRITLACAVVLVASEAFALVKPTERGRVALVRFSATILATVAALVEALYLTPGIVALHAGGAMRHVGPAGLELDRLHKLAELDGKAQVVFLACVLASFAFDRSPIAAPARGDAEAAHEP